MMATDRRADIMAAVERLLTRGGVSAVTMRAVATEAGVSLRLVQYYGRTKSDLLAATLERLADRSAVRWQERMRHGQCDAGNERIVVLESFFDEALPTDRASREFHRIGVTLESLAITDPDMAAATYAAHLSGLADQLATLLRSSGSDEATARLLALEAMSLAHGLGTLLMVGQLDVSEARALVAGYLARL